jgi:hypothetical protein
MGLLPRSLYKMLPVIMSKPAHDNYMALAARLVRTCLLRHETLSESVSCRSVLRGRSQSVRTKPNKLSEFCANL